MILGGGLWAAGPDEDPRADRFGLTVPKRSGRMTNASVVRAQFVTPEEESALPNDHICGRGARPLTSGFPA